jgi:hypothetical protein
MYLAEDMDSFFEPALLQIEQLVAEKLQQLHGSCDKLLLVGGFGSSKALAVHLRRRFAGHGVRDVVVPESAEIAVVMGGCYSCSTN